MRRDPLHLLPISLSLFVLFVLMLAIFLSINCASSTLGKSLNVGVIAAGTADLISTRHAITSGQGHEGNPVAGQDAWRQTLVKALGAGAVIGFAQVLEQQKPVLAHVIRAAAITGWSVVSWRNYSIARR